MRAKRTRSPRRTESGEALTDLILTIFKSNVDLVDAAPLIARDPSMTAMRWQILNALKAEDKTAAQLGREMGISRQGALLSVQSLEDQGYVSLNDNAEDQRTKNVALTSAGLEKLNEVNSYQSAWVNQLATHFDKKQLDIAVDVVGKLRLLTLTSVSVVNERASRSTRNKASDSRDRGI
ncbi:DNA-binding transcriptional regulator, MarR family [Variovorax sp. YR752]|uniref:MarR family winged helix-turn-helix transcriptional regulator n=1 Tax=Variovorax sp. YR752 TaxID=1884383 RepID=UPI000BDA78B6|nr:helix-turn-helix domain-containing protein [Variovorax sp. YR752]SOE06300.1 DNA-binding transcriptional regulator, MarR family [Variovorax sp. YR752]